MDEEAHNLSLFNPSRGSLVLSKPGHVLSRMTLDLLPVAQQKRRNDDAEAEPSFQRGMEAYARKDFETALRELNHASELGHRLAQFELATMHLDGVAGSADHALAYHWFHRAAEQGDANSLNKLGWMCEAGFGVERDQTRAVNWFRQAAERGHLEAQFNLAAKYDNGEGVAQNHAEAARWYRLAAEQGLADARFFLAQALEVGEGLPKNIDEALDWYILASEQGHRSAKISLWGHALAGRYLPEDETEKIFIEVLGAELGHPLAEYKYGYRLMFGEGVSPNLELSCKFYQRAANRGFSPACEHLWLMYIGGIKLPNSVSINPSWRLLEADSVYAELSPPWMYLEPGSSDVDESTEFRRHRIRALGGKEDAISNLACDYYFGRGTSKSYEKALDWLRKGVAVDDVYCHYLLGYMMRHGIACQRDEEGALSHLKKAAKRGHVPASRMAASILLADKNASSRIKQGLGLLTDCAQKGDADSQFDLGYLYTVGELVPSSDEQAIFWYRKAADQNHMVALFNLGVRYESGLGLEKDPRLALALYKRSAECGFVRACEELIDIYQKGRFGESNPQEAERWSLEASRLKVEAEKENQNEKLGIAEIANTGTSRRRQRLEQKRSLQRKASDLLGRE